MKLKICSFNSRCSTANDGINAFFCRTHRIIEFLKNENPDIIGLQEITPEMRDWFVDNLDEYYIVGAGRNADNSGESASIAFKKKDFQLISCETVMLSSTPAVFGSRYEGADQSSCPRAYTKVKLKHWKIAYPISVYNVHTDHIGKIARELASMQLLQDMTSCGTVFFATGDYNATPDSEEIKLITGCRGVIDSTKEIKNSFHAYGKKGEDCKIDYIFASEGVKLLESYAVEDVPIDGVYISDHYPIASIFEL